MTGTISRLHLRYGDRPSRRAWKRRYVSSGKLLH